MCFSKIKLFISNNVVLLFKKKKKSSTCTSVIALGGLNCFNRDFWHRITDVSGIILQYTPISKIVQALQSWILKISPPPPILVAQYNLRYVWLVCTFWFPSFNLVLTRETSWIKFQNIYSSRPRLQEKNATSAGYLWSSQAVNFNIRIFNVCLYVQVLFGQVGLPSLCLTGCRCPR